MIDIQRASRLGNFIGFQIGWFACVLGAAHGYWALGPVVVALILIIQLSAVSNPAAEIRLVLLSLILGYFFDSSLIQMGFLSLNANVLAPWGSSPWMAAMWVNFALTLRHSMNWLRGRYLLGAALGAISGPLAYLAGARLGAMEILAGPLSFGLALGSAWAAAIPLLVWVSWRGEQ
jgi:hypothetical protein